MISLHGISYDKEINQKGIYFRDSNLDNAVLKYSDNNYEIYLTNIIKSNYLNIIKNKLNIEFRDTCVSVDQPDVINKNSLYLRVNKKIFPTEFKEYENIFTIAGVRYTKDFDYFGFNLGFKFYNRASFIKVMEKLDVNIINLNKELDIINHYFSYDTPLFIDVAWYYENNRYIFNKFSIVNIFNNNYRENKIKEIPFGYTFNLSNLDFSWIK